MPAECESAANELRIRLLDKSLPIEKRFRALFSLRNLKGSDVAREGLSEAMLDDSCLLAHESAFALGQMQDEAAIPALKNVLQNTSFHPMVRHEAAEALGAIGVQECKDILLLSSEDPAVEVRETVELALSRIAQVSETRKKNANSPFLSVDPAMAAFEECSVSELRQILLDEKRSMADKYSALFSLRNKRTPDSVAAVVAALGCPSALLRHEVAYVLGQLQDESASEALMKTLEQQDEHPMVRHEAAEALGAIADVKSIELLRRFQKDSDPIVAQSCDVALDMLNFELQEGAFQYADVDVVGSH